MLIMIGSESLEASPSITIGSIGVSASGFTGFPLPGIGFDALQFDADNASKRSVIVPVEGAADGVASALEMTEPEDVDSPGLDPTWADAMKANDAPWKNRDWLGVLDVPVPLFPISMFAARGMSDKGSSCEGCASSLTATWGGREE
jgi:hypothetical protein